MSRGRAVDAGAAFVVWASPRDRDHGAADSDCPHGALVDMRFDTLVPQQSIVLSVRAVELADGAVHAATERRELTCLLESGQCVAHDAAGEAFLAASPWFATRLEDRMDLVRERASRAAAQADRHTSARRRLATHEAGTMVAFDELFPADWDLLVTHEGHHYWVIDQYCAKANCDCGELALDVHELPGDGSAPKIGHARINVREPQTKIRATSALIIDVYNALWAQSKERLRARLREVRRALTEDAPADLQATTALATARAPTANAASVFAQPRPSRNETCPCGSGKKFKRCCLGARSAPRS